MIKFQEHTTTKFPAICPNISILTSLIYQNKTSDYSKERWNQMYYLRYLSNKTGLEWALSAEKYLKISETEQQ